MGHRISGLPAIPLVSGLHGPLVLQTPPGQQQVQLHQRLAHRAARLAAKKNKQKKHGIRTREEGSSGPWVIFEALNSARASHVTNPDQTYIHPRPSTLGP